MTFTDFETLVARHGSDPANWPDPGLAERADVKAWLATERELDARLARAHVPALSANFTDRVVSNLPAERPASRRLWVPSLVAASLVAVFSAGILLSAPDPAPVEDDAWETFAEDAGFSDLYAWVEGEPSTAETGS